MDVNVNAKGAPRFPWGIAVLVFVAIMLPFLVAWRTAGAEWRFSGFLLNPVDGYSYLAKMYQGWLGSWRYRLLYSAEPGAGAHIQLFYLFLGHLARWLGAEAIVVFHVARLIAAGVLLAALWRFFGVVLPSRRARRMAFALAALGSGMGWLALPFGLFTVDFWVAEAFPFLTMYANPHFPLGLALMVFLLTPGPEDSYRWRVGALLTAALLSVVSPFGVILVLTVRAGWAFYGWLRRRRLYWQPLAFIATGGAPLLFYYAWVTRTDPVVAQWNAQNQTPSPPLWNLLIALSPIILLAVWAVWRLLPVARQPLSAAHLAIWAALGLALLYLPVGLQRRFMMGLYVPLAGLATLALERQRQHAPRRYRLLATTLFLLALPTNLLVLLSGVDAAARHDPLLYLQGGEARALAWIAANAPPDALVLASPQSGTFIPAYTGRRVIYGHPFETVNAEAERAAVEGFFRSEIDAEAFLARRGVTLIFYGPREAALGALPDVPGFTQVFQDDGVTIYGRGE